MGGAGGLAAGEFRVYGLGFRVQGCQVWVEGKTAVSFT